MTPPATPPPVEPDSKRPVPPGNAPPRVHRPLTLWHYLWIVGAALVVIAGLNWLGPILTPFLVGIILAYLGTPLVDRATTRRIPRALSTLAVVLMFGVALVALFFVLVPLIQSEAILAARRVPDLLQQLSERVVPWVEEHFGVTLGLDLTTVREFLSQNASSAQQLSLTLLSGVKTGGLILLSLLVNLALIPVVMFYLLRDWKMIFLRMDDLLPRAWRAKARSIASDIDAVLAEFLRGQVLVMIVLACYYAIGLSIAGLDRAISIGILTGLLVFIPYVGFGLGLVLGVVAAALQWHGLPGFIAVVAVYGVGQLFGFAGILLALPVSAALLVGVRHLRAAYEISPIYNRE